MTNKTRYQQVTIANFRGLVFFITLRNQFAENASKRYHVYKGIVVLHIYNTTLGISLAGHLVTKNRSLIHIKF